MCQVKPGGTCVPELQLVSGRVRVYKCQVQTAQEGRPRRDSFGDGVQLQIGLSASPDCKHDG